VCLGSLSCLWESVIATPVLQKAVGLIEQQHRALALSLREHGRHVLLGLAHVLAHQVAGLTDAQRFAQGLRDVRGQRALARAGRAMEAQGAVAARLQRRIDLVSSGGVPAQ